MGKTVDDIVKRVPAVPGLRGAVKRGLRVTGLIPEKNGSSQKALTYGSSAGDDRDQPSTSRYQENAPAPWGLGHLAVYAEELPKVRQKDLKGFFYIPLRLERRFHREEYEYEGKTCVHRAFESDLEHKALQWNNWRTRAGKDPYWPIVKSHSMTEKTWLRSKPLAGLEPGKTKLYILLNKLKGNQSDSDSKQVIGGYEAPISGLGPFGRLTSGERLWTAKDFAKHIQQAGLNQDYRFIRFYIPFSACPNNKWAEKFARSFVEEMNKLGYHRLTVRGYRGEVSMDYREFPHGGGFHRYSRLLIRRDQWDEEHDVRPKELRFEISSWDVDSRSNTERALALARDGYRHAKNTIKRATDTFQNETTSRLLRHGFSHLKDKMIG
jgi:hypothetical protein